MSNPETGSKCKKCGKSDWWLFWTVLFLLAGHGPIALLCLIIWLMS